jgi:hypothetical protein
MAEPRKSRREPRASAVPREVLQSIDPLERKVALVLTAIAFIFSIVAVIVIIFVKPTTTYLIKPIKHGTTLRCHFGYHLVAKMCAETKPTPASELWLNFVLLTAAAVILLVAALKRRRTFIVFASLFIGLALGPFSFGLPFVIAGGWLMWRAWRLQRYGVATFAGVSAITRQRADDKRAGRTPEPLARAASAPDAEIERPRRPSEPSKRYTPKKPPRKKR